MEYGLGNNLYAITGITTDEHAAIMIEDFVLKGRGDIVNDIPIIVRITYAAE